MRREAPLLSSPANDLRTWTVADLADTVEAGLLARRAADDAEQAIYGFDALAELGLHPLIHAAFRDAGYGVFPEQRYPGAWNRKRRSEGRRCDLVLTRHGLPLRDPTLRDTLFGQAEAEDADTAYWLEVKTVAQFEQGRPFRRYSAELFAPVTDDVKKVWSDGVIRFGGLLLVLFTLNQEVAEHDIAAWHRRCIDKGVPAGCPAVRGFDINDRVGNGWCAVAVFGIRGV